MGSPWKMFTKDQAHELIDGTNYLWTTINGVNGAKLTSKTNTSKYIFLPAGGWWGETTLNDVYNTGYYFCTRLRLTSTAYTMRFISSSINSTSYTDRRVGQSVRAIH